MNAHEYQAKIILKKFGIPIPDFLVVSSLEQAEKALDEMGIEQGVIKAQVHAGGRGKAGGVKIGRNRKELLEHCKNIIGMKIVNNQTGKDGVISHKVMISVLTDIKKEGYLGAVIDRERARPMLIVSPDGGMDIEEVAEKNPERILTVPIGLDGSLKPYQLRNIAQFMGWKGPLAEQGMKIALKISKAFIETDASLLEINPLVESTQGDLWAVDAKLSVDDNALYRQPEIAEFEDPTQYPHYEAAARKHELAYIALEGNIGCMVNGAGLAMATMDIIRLYGGRPANFLDVGGSATKEKIAEGFKILLSDKGVKGILVNIFGGIMDCEVLASGIIAAASQLSLHVPLVVRMEGTNVQKGKALLKASGLPIITADGLTEAAEKVTASIKNTR